MYISYTFQNKVTIKLAFPLPNEEPLLPAIWRTVTLKQMENMVLTSATWIMSSSISQIYTIISSVSAFSMQFQYLPSQTVSISCKLHNKQYMVLLRGTCTIANKSKRADEGIQSSTFYAGFYLQITFLGTCWVIVIHHTIKKFNVAWWVTNVVFNKWNQTTNLDHVANVVSIAHTLLSFTEIILLYQWELWIGIWTDWPAMGIFYITEDNTKLTVAW